MTRLTQICLMPGKRPIKKPNNYRPVPLFKQTYPAELKDSVASRGTTAKRKPCVNEISLMLECLQQHEFDQAACAEQISKFNACMQSHQKKIKELEEQEAKGILVALPGGKYPKKQLNAFLKKYPQPK